MKVCKIDGCENKHQAKGLCDKHYRRLLVNGSPHVVQQLRGISAMERFVAYVQKTSGCWLWTASLTSTGYGQMMVHGKKQKAHRVSWEIHHGPIPDGMCVCHACHNPRCVKPEHLYLGTQSDNVADMKASGRARGRYSKLKEIA
jgi:hypothetical protein